MATLKDISRRIGAVKSTAKITSAMKMVAAAKLKKAQKSIESARPYVLKLGDMMSELVSALGGEYSHPLIEQREEIKSIAIIVIASDRGLCGSFNNSLFRQVKYHIEKELKAENPELKVTIIPVGQRTCGFFKKETYPVAKMFPGVFNDLKFEVAQEIVDTVQHGFIGGEFDKVLLYYNEFVNVIKQTPKLDTLLPISPKAEEENEGEKKFNVDYIFEPGQEEILEVLLPKMVNISVWRALLESNAAENAARMMAMDNATTNANDLMKYLEMVFNKARQAAITTEMLEIVSGAEALRGQ